MPTTKELQPDRVIHNEHAKFSENFFESDIILQDYIQKYIPDHARKFIVPKWLKTGERAACEMDELSIQADQNGPELIKRDKWGEDLNEIRFHPAYWKLMDVAVESWMMRIKWDSQYRSRFAGYSHSLGFISGYLYSLSEMGQYCPLCMTDGAARLIDCYADDETRKRILPGFSSQNGRSLTTGAMYLTEKSGGSDVGANLMKAIHEKGRWYRLYGEKWFCSNANADVAMVLARTDPEKPGTRGLSLFLHEKILEDGTPNQPEIIRVKEKMGVRSMASAECQFNGQKALLIGDEFEGMKMMLDMINLSRIYNSVAGVSGTRRALIEAYQFVTNRRAFGSNLMDHALIREKLHELGALHVGNFLLVWRMLRALDRSDMGDEKESQLLRMIIPMAKWWSAETSVYVARESMELMGGIGYIEDQVMPKLFRDVNVLPIWEGSGNIIVLDMLRAMEKSEGMHLLKEEIEHLIGQSGESKKMNSISDQIFRRVEQLGSLDRDECEATAKPLFRELIHLYQSALMLQEEFDWAEMAYLWYRDRVMSDSTNPVKPETKENIAKLIAWDV